MITIKRSLCCCGRMEICPEDDGCTSIRLNDYIHELPGEHNFCGSVARHRERDLRLMATDLAESLQNVMGYVDTPIARRKLGINDNEEMQGILEVARGVIKKWKVNNGEIPFGSCSKCEEPLNEIGDCMNKKCSIHYMSFPETMTRTPDDEEDAADMIKKGFGDK